MSKCVYILRCRTGGELRSGCFSFSLSRHSTTKKQKRSETQTISWSTLFALVSQTPHSKGRLSRGERERESTFCSFFCSCGCGLSLCSFFLLFYFPASCLVDLVLCLVPLWIQFLFPALPRPALDSFSFYSHPTR